MQSWRSKAKLNLKNWEKVAPAIINVWDCDAGWVCRGGFENHNIVGLSKRHRQWREKTRSFFSAILSRALCLLVFVGWEKVKRENFLLTICVPANFGLFRGRAIWKPFRSRHCPPAHWLSHLLPQLFTKVSQISWNIFSQVAILAARGRYKW